AANDTNLKRFRAEAEAVANLTHAHIVQVYAIGEDQGLHYMALEFVDGRNLRDYLEKKGVPDLPVALDVMRQVASALERAGELPFRGATAFDVALQHVQGEVRPLGSIRPDLPPQLCAVVHRMMARRPEDRYQSAREILNDLARLKDGAGLPTTTMAALGAS